MGQWCHRVNPALLFALSLPLLAACGSAPESAAPVPRAESTIAGTPKTPQPGVSTDLPLQTGEARTGDPTWSPVPASPVPASPQPGVSTDVVPAPAPAPAPTPADGVARHKVATTGAASIRLAQNPRDGALYALNPVKGLLRLTLDAAASTTPAASPAEIAPDGTPSGMAFGPDGALYIVSNRKVGSNQTQALVRRGAPADAGFRWETLLTTAPYPLSDTPFDHQFNGIVVSPDGAALYINSGSRTDHGEVEDNHGAFPQTREVPLTSAIFRIATSARDLTLPNDAAALDALGVVFARGTRNAYDLAFAPDGALFAIDNGPDADYPDELNWLQAGQHYGFPWRFGAQDNPQQRPDYDAAADKRLSTDFTAVKLGTYRNDPGFPPAPPNMTDALANSGPDAVQYRAADGSQQDAAKDGKPLNTFTPHRSPLGLVFVSGDALPSNLRPAEGALSAFVLSWGSAGGTLTDRGQDLLHLTLQRSGATYTIRSTQLASGFQNPIDAVLVQNRLYVLEYGADGAVWELTFAQ